MDSQATTIPFNDTETDELISLSGGQDVKSPPFSIFRDPSVDQLTPTSILRADGRRPLQEIRVESESVVKFRDDDANKENVDVEKSAEVEAPTPAPRRIFLQKSSSFPDLAKNMEEFEATWRNSCFGRRANVTIRDARLRRDVVHVDTIKVHVDVAVQTEGPLSGNASVKSSTTTSVSLNVANPIVKRMAAFYRKKASSAASNLNNESSNSSSAVNKASKSSSAASKNSLSTLETSKASSAMETSSGGNPTESPRSVTFADLAPNSTSTPTSAAPMTASIDEIFPNSSKHRNSPDK